MKKLLLMITALSFLAIAGAPARAQVVDSLEFNIPFAFTVKNKTLPAGEYTVQRLGSLSEDVMEITSSHGRGERMLVVVESAQMNKTPDKSELLFDRIGDQYFLSKIFEGGSNLGAEMPKSRAERKLKEEGAIIKVDSVVVLARSANGSGS